MGEEILNLHTFGSVAPKRITCKKVRVCLRNLKTQQAVELELLETRQVSTLTNPKVLDESVRRKLHDKGLQLADIPVNGMETNELGILIGSEHYWKVVTGRIERVNDTLVLLESKFGWLAQGSIPTNINVSEIPDVETINVSVGEEQELSNQLRRFWETESIGVTMEKEQSLENQKGSA